MTVPVLMLDSKKKRHWMPAFTRLLPGCRSGIFLLRAERKLAETILTTRGAAF